MTRFGRTFAIVLGVLLASAWSLGAGAGPVRKKGGKKARPSAVQGGGQGGHQPAPASPSFRPAGGGRDRAEPQRDRAEPQRDRERPRPSYDGRQGRPTDPPARMGRPTVRRPLPVPGRGAQDVSRMNRPRPSTLPLAGKPPVTVKRGGVTFRQETVLRGDQSFVRRTRLDHLKHRVPGATSASHHGGPPGSDRGGSRHYSDSGRYYHHHHYGHHDYWVYVHYWAYQPWFWGFYFAPFPAPWYYTWVWVGAPWHVAWGWYFAPYPYYAAPSYWVTDYTISRMLADEYERGYEAGQESVAGTPISEPVKEQLRVQVDATAQAFQTERTLTLEEALADPDYLYIVDAPISATTTAGAVCALTGGDILRAAGEPDLEVPVAQMSVVTAKQGDCPAGATVNVAWSDLQEMLNTFAETVDDGLHELEGQPTPR